MAKKPVLVDLDRGVVATLGDIEKASEYNHIFLRYYPLNSIKSHKYPEALKSDDVKTWRPANSRIPGAESEIVIICSGNNSNSFMQFINKAYLEENKALKERIKHLELSVETANRDSQTALAGIESHQARMKKINKEDRKSPFDFNRKFDDFERV